MRISGGLVVTMDERRRLVPHGVVDIEGDRISYVGEGGGPTRVGGAAIDARGMAVVPGFVNAHTHIASNLLARGLLDDVTGFPWLERLWELKANFSTEDLFVASKVGIAEMLLSGTTCYNELFDGYDPEPGISAAQQAGLRAAAGWCLADGGVYADSAGQSWRDLARIDELKRRYHGSADGRLQLVIAPHAPYTVSKELAQAARNAADEHGLRLHTHLSEGEQEISEIRQRFGQTPVQYFAEAGLLGPDLIAAHCSMFDDRDIELFARSGASIAHCPTCNSRYKTGYLPLARVRRAGVCVGLGTDGPASNDSLDMLAEAKFATTLHRYVNNDVLALSAEEAFALATIEAARAMGLGATLGSIEVGKKADVVLIDLLEANCSPVHDVYSALVLTSAGRNVDTVIVDGKVLVEHGELTGWRVRDDVRLLNERAHALRQASLNLKLPGFVEAGWI